MARQIKGETLRITIQLELTHEKVKPMEIYCPDWKAQVRINVEEYARNQMEKVYSDNVPEAVREYVRMQNGIKDKVKVASSDENEVVERAEPIHTQFPEEYESPNNSCAFDE